MKLCEHIEGRSSIYAVEGSAAHWVAELALKNKVSPHTYIGRVYSEDGYDIEVTREMCDFIQEYIDYVHSIPGELIGVEVKVNLSELMGVKDQFGTSDIIKYDPQTRTLHVIDLKYGKGVKVFA